jgi:hypothetical protein
MGHDLYGAGELLSQSRLLECLLMAHWAECTFRDRPCLQRCAQTFGSIDRNGFKRSALVAGRSACEA